jgi:hypothetical protein
MSKTRFTPAYGGTHLEPFREPTQAAFIAGQLALLNMKKAPAEKVVTLRKFSWEERA